MCVNGIRGCASDYEVISCSEGWLPMGQLGKKIGIKYMPGDPDHPNNVLIATAREGWPSRRATSFSAREELRYECDSCNLLGTILFNHTHARCHLPSQLHARCTTQTIFSPHRVEALAKAGHKEYYGKLEKKDEYSAFKSRRMDLKQTAKVEGGTWVWRGCSVKWLVHVGSQRFACSISWLCG